MAYLDLVARYALDVGLQMIVEGILYTRNYGAMLTQLVADHRGITTCYRYELSFDETVRRHTSESKAAEYGSDTMREWWLDTDPLPGITECRFSPEVPLDDVTTRVLTDSGWISEAVYKRS